MVPLRAGISYRRKDVVKKDTQLRSQMFDEVQQLLRSTGARTHRPEATARTVEGASSASRGASRAVPWRNRSRFGELNCPWLVVGGGWWVVVGAWELKLVGAGASKSGLRDMVMLVG
eukprot:Skav221776  [mRNA]  locus=scaffold2426:98707:99409:+ [translate_table: standard]